MEDNSIKRVIILGAFAIIGILVIQSYWVMQTWDLKESEFHQTVKIALWQTAKDIAKQDSIVLPTRDLINQRSSNYYVVNINNIIHAPSLEYYLGKALIEHNLILDFEYGIYDCSSNKMVEGNYCKLTTEETKKEPILGDLPKMEGLNYYFGVKFPTRQSYLASQMYLSIFFTGLLLLSIIFFVYAISIIFRQKRLSEMQKDFINNMTHEFKTPISTIKVSAEVFANAPEVQENPRLTRYTDIIRAQNNRLNDQVEKVLQIARVEQNSFQLKLEQIDFNELIHGVLNSVALKVESKKGVLKRKIQLNGAPILADKHHLTNILYNLLDNALKYCNKTPLIRVAALEKNGEIQLSITDNGIGIKKEHQNKIFDKFYRVPTGNIHNVKGFGLGLFYIKHICKSHNWKLSLYSKEGEGTNISIFIPIYQTKQGNVWNLLKNYWRKIAWS